MSEDKEMWNHKLANSVIGVGDGGGDVELNSESGFVGVVDEKVEKHVDLSNYLTYLHSLFNRPTSDSEESDSEINNTDEVQNAVGFGGNSALLASNVTQQDRFLSSTQEGINSIGKSGGNYASTFEASTTSSSSSSSPGSQDEDSSFLPNDLTPMSDMELNNLLKKTNYLGPDADPISFELDDTSTTDSDNKKNTKKKKKKSKKKNDDGVNHRHNKPNSDGKGNGSGHSGYRGDSSGPGMNNSGSSNNTDSSSPNKNSGGSNSSRLCNSRTRKQSLKFLRAEASNNSSSSSHSSEYSLSNSREIKSDGGIDDEQRLLIRKDVKGGLGKKNGKSAFNKKSTGTPLSQAIHNSVAKNFAASSKDFGLPITPERLSKDDEDNNSLSDYISMAATAAATTAQVPPLPLHLGYVDDDEDDDDEDFEFDEKVFNSICLKLSSSSSAATDDSIQELNSSQQSSNPRKRKLEVNKDVHSNEEPESKKQMVQKPEKVIELLNLKRRKIYLYICKKEIPKSQRTMMGTHKEAISAKRKLAQACTRFVRQKAIQSQKIMKESVWRAKRLTREMQTFWKQADRAEKESRRRREKQAEEQRKLDEEMLESKRHLKNLNFIITQAELYSQTVSKKLSRTSLTPNEELEIFKHYLDENEPQADSDQSEWEGIKKLIKLNVERAIKSQSTTVKQYLPDVGSVESYHELTGPPLKIFKSDLKLYQIKGLQWLINLYNQGINGVLADDMELGRVSQSIGFLCHLAEKRGIWGPFLIVTPSTQIQNWHQEFARLVNDFKVILYTGNPQERKAIRSSWNSSNNLSKKDAAFHVVISTCQIVSADLKYVDKINWRYFILDEAHSTKSPSCSRWKALLSFSCRNRLLISKPPVISGIGEIWSLLHFLAPSLYDTHDEFNEWFSKDIESLVENKKLLNERGLARLQASLIPFVLRRAKRDVESGLTIVKCPLSFRQRSLYRAIKLQIKKEETVVKHSPMSNGIHNSTMMNLIAQLRKICNHPDLVEERHACSSLHLSRVYHYYPKIIYNRKCSNKTFRKRLLETRFNIFNPANTHRSLFCDVKAAQFRKNRRLYNPCDISVNPALLANGSQVYEASSEWSFLRLMNISCGELWDTQFGTPLQRLKLIIQLGHKFTQEALKTPNRKFVFFPTRCNEREIPRELMFVHPDESFYAWGVEKLYALSNLGSKQTALEVRPMQRIKFPEFLCQLCPRVISEGWEPFFVDSCVGRKSRESRLCEKIQPNNGYEEADPIYRYFKEVCPYRLCSVVLPEKESFINDSGKFTVLRKLMSQLLAGAGAVEGIKIIICSRTSKMIDVLQDFLRRLKIAFTYVQETDILHDKTKSLEIPTGVVLMQTHLFLREINLPTYNTVIFYDSDSTLSADQQIIDRALSQGHTQHLAVYRLVSKGTIEDQMFVKQGDGGRFKQDSLKTKEVVSLVHEDDELKKSDHQKEPDTTLVEPSSCKGTSSQAIQSSPEPFDTVQLNVSWKERKTTADPQVATSLISNVQLETSYGESMEGSLPPSPNLSDEIETDFPDVDYSESTFDDSVGTPTSSSYFDEYGRSMDWNVSVSDYEEDMTYISKKPRIGRGTGKRGRPPSRVRVQMREVDSGQIPVKRGPGRPRLRPIGPPNQGVRGRRPGRPPLSKKAETVSSSLTPLTPSQRVFGIYSSPDINMS